MSEQVKHAITAAQKFKSWGRFASMRYCQNRGVDLSLWYLARRLEACKGLPLEGRFAL